MDTRRPSEFPPGIDKQEALATVPKAPFAAFHPDGKTLAILSNKYGASCIRVWTGVDGHRLWRTLTFQNTQASWVLPAIGFSPSGRWLAATQWGVQDHNGLILWDTTDWKSTEIAWPEPYHIVDALYSPDGRWLAVAAEDTTEEQSGTGTGEWTVQVLNLDDGRVNNQILRQHGRFMAMTFLPDDNLQVAASSHDFTRLWRLPTQPIDNHTMELQTWLALGARLDRDKHVEAIPSVDWIRLQQELQALQPQHAALSRQ